MFIMQHTGPEVMYYLKLFAVTPFLVGCTVLYARITKMVGRDARFNIVIAYFFGFLALSYFFLIPNLNHLQLDYLADSLTKKIPKMLGVWEAIRYWPLSLLYINAEAWGTMCLGVLFWTFVNEIICSQQAKRLYTFIALGSSIGLVVAGIFVITFKKNFNLQLGFVTLVTGLLLLLYNFFARDIKNNPACYQQIATNPPLKKAQMSLSASLKFLLQSSYLRLIAALVLSYNIFISLFESIWKAEIKALLISTNDPTISAIIYGNQNTYAGIVTLVLGLFFSAPIMRKGWKFAASFTPAVALLCTIIFFVFLYFQDSLRKLMSVFHMTPTMMAVMVGLANVVLIKSSKYILFDTTKEQTYIPLDEELKVTGKAAVDGLGSRVGKSLGSFILTMVFIPFLGDGQISNVRYWIFLLTLMILVSWIIVVNKLSVKFHKLTEEQARRLVEKM